MKCPKCGYLGFEHVERCRNCGYDFSLSATDPTPELPIRREPAVERPVGDLPLFSTSGISIADGEPLITKASPPRAPLAVRRATPEVARVRPEQPRPVSMDLSLEPDAPVANAQPWHRRDSEDAFEDATVAARFVAGVIDLLILAVVDAVVIYFTMQICGITLGEIGLLPKVPLLAFLFVQNGGYLVAFTAGGQTLGKMAAGIRVVSADSESTLDLGRAFLRTLVWFVLAVPVGLGFLTALFSRNHRGLHDRFAGTRVVR
jgi:uncharacterized RDD family membrane protein YckC